MQDRKKELAAKIESYINGELDHATKQELEQWMHELDLLENRPIAIEEHKVALKSRIDQRLLPQDSIKTKRLPGYPYWSIAAALALFFAVGLYFFTLHTTVRKQEEFVHATTLKPVLPTTQVISNTTNNDTLLLLQDSTRVRLLANSRLKLKVPFESDRRDVQLEGKAFFEVAHDSKRPFSVLSGNIVTTALGTSFWVEQAHPGAKPTVRLITGKVSIKQRQQSGQEILLAYLTPGQHWQASTVASSQKAAALPTHEPTDEPLETSLFFHHKPLDEVFPALAAFYQTTIIFKKDDVTGMSFYGSYDRENQVEQILKTICVANDLKMEWHEQQNSYTIRKVN